ncbi:hypothetical protein ACFWHR_04390 [Leucobacter sp. NPDC058333]|uniref:hypothetical protein n=1 Tax=Leucobacter sp. NPDC058333 TaxID=3346450 RepID=UPI003667C4B2
MTDEAHARPAPRRSRRASRPAPTGVDPRPSEHPLDARAAEDRLDAWGDGAAAVNGGRAAPSAHDEALKRDRPPHWG